jgi:hypothetical protein
MSTKYEAPQCATSSILPLLILLGPDILLRTLAEELHLATADHIFFEKKVEGSDTRCKF